MAELCPTPVGSDFGAASIQSMCAQLEMEVCGSNPRLKTWTDSSKEIEHGSLDGGNESGSQEVLSALNAMQPKREPKVRCEHPVKDHPFRDEGEAAQKVGEWLAGDSAIKMSRNLSCLLGHENS